MMLPVTTSLTARRQASSDEDSEEDKDKKGDSSDDEGEPDDDSSSSSSSAPKKKKDSKKAKKDVGDSKKSKKDKDGSGKDGGSKSKDKAGSSADAPKAKAKAAVDGKAAKKAKKDSKAAVTDPVHYTSWPLGDVQALSGQLMSLQAAIGVTPGGMCPTEEIRAWYEGIPEAVREAEAVMVAEVETALGDGDETTNLSARQAVASMLAVATQVEQWYELVPYFRGRRQQQEVSAPSFTFACARGRVPRSSLLHFMSSQHCIGD